MNTFLEKERERGLEREGEAWPDSFTSVSVYSVWTAVTRLDVRPGSELLVE